MESASDAKSLYLQVTRETREPRLCAQMVSRQGGSLVSYQPDPLSSANRHP